jgi:hypothetical protein
MDPIKPARAVEDRPGGDVVSGRPWFSICCIGCLLVIAAIGIGGFILLRVLTGPTSMTLTSLPDNYPKDLPLYRLEDAASISLVKGSQKSRMLQLLTGPAKLFVQATGGSASSSVGTDLASTTQDIKNAISAYSSQLEHQDTLTVTWKNLKASRLDVVRYYEDLFKKAGLKEQATRDDATATDLVFASRPDEAIQIDLQDLPDVSGIDELVITVDYSAK